MKKNNANNASKKKIYSKWQFRKNNNSVHVSILNGKYVL